MPASAAGGDASGDTTSVDGTAGAVAHAHTIDGTHNGEA
jgi:hypothetical protein